MKTNLNPNEWIVMNALWEHSPRTLSETIEAIGDKADWNYKTYQSYMVLLAKKGYVTSEKRGRDKFYAPAVTREACVEEESRSLLKKLESDSVKLLVASMVREGDLSAADRMELLGLLETLIEKEDGAK